jgi:hypothetical protein
VVRCHTHTLSCPCRAFDVDLGRAAESWVMTVIARSCCSCGQESA